MFCRSFPLAETVNKLRAGSLDLSEHIRQICDRIDAHEPAIQALLPEPDRRKRLLKEAAALKDRYPKPGTRPLLFGLLLGVKDIFRADGFATRAGSRLPEALFAGIEAEVVTRLKNAGALVVGKTVTTEFAYFAPGPTRNPHNTAHTPGGSSSGSAAAVAAGFCSLALGTQTIGSVARPASFCGVIGFKPSYGRISTEGVIPFSPSADHVGFFTQDLAGASITASLLCRNWQADQRGARKQPVLALPQGPYLEQASEEVAKLFGKMVERLEQAGYLVKRVRALDTIEEVNRQHRRMIAAEMAQVHARWFPAYKELYSPATGELIRQGQEVEGAELAKLRAGREKLCRELESLREQAGADLWISPAAPTDAPPGILSTGNPVMNLPWTFSGLPCLVLPAALSTKKLPVGLQIAASFDRDEQLFSWAEEMERVFTKTIR